MSEEREEFDAIFGPNKLSWVDFELKKLLRSRSRKLCELGRSFDEIKRLDKKKRRRRKRGERMDAWKYVRLAWKSHSYNVSEFLVVTDSFTEDREKKVEDKRLDSWEWGIDPVEGFTVNNTRRFINSKNLEKRVHETRWYKFVPNKLNILVWRTILDRLPTRNNLIEDYKRVFVECDVKVS
uniref:Reverse transcriptase zinc-binding domain-containing protein n=1 Tax=Lactuca sativa TaxID=4236 RepID=A0A9R1V4J3_LACSA|nr:hypothetical protein LSAT_V11C700344190 [Lactuca sativa]